jgi:DNA-directed RNA polymerase specialized sigma24 family protein
MKMSKYRDKTTMGGLRETFQTTCWIGIRDAKTSDNARREVILDNLLRTYWKPAYCYLRRKGYDNDAAKDLTQGFFHEIVLGRELIQQADESKGRFRTFLLTALDHYVSNIYRKETAKKRSPKGQLRRFGEFDGADGPEIPTQVSPEEAFNYTWASNLLDDVLAKVKDECYETGKEAHWEVFNAKVLTSIFGAGQTCSLTEICKKYDIDSESKASNMIVTVKRRFKAILKRCLRQFVQSDSEVEDEFNHLLKILSDSSAR